MKIILSSTTNQHSRDGSRRGLRPRIFMHFARAAALVLVLILLMESPQTSSAQPSAYNPPALNTSVVEEVWANKSYPASDFRQDSVPPRFALWPENLPYLKFVYFCEQENPPTRLLSDFIYRAGEGRIVTRPYFDLGLVDRHYAPYFMHWKINWQVAIHRTVTPVVRCEYTDLQRLYNYRLDRNVLGTGVGYGVAAVGVLEFGVMVFITVNYFLQLNPSKVSATDQNSTNQISTDQSSTYVSRLTTFLRESWTDAVRDWVHLVLLVMVGFAMMEGAGHSNFFEWRSMLFYNTGVTYTYLTLSAMLSSFLYQCALFLQNRKPVAAPQPTLSDSVPRTASTRTTELPTTSSDDETLKNSVKGSVLWTDDWKYQRIFGQSGVLLLMGAYLLSVDDDLGKGMDSLAGVIVGAVIVACLWSFAVTVVVALRSVRRLFRICRMYLRTRNAKPDPNQ